jgi:TolB protein
MHKRVFAHSLPIWIGSIGSIDPGAYAASAADLLRALDATEEKARTAYGDRPITKLYGRYELARQYLNRSAQ